MVAIGLLAVCGSTVTVATSQISMEAAPQKTPVSIDRWLVQGSDFRPPLPVEPTPPNSTDDRYRREPSNVPGQLLLIQPDRLDDQRVEQRHLHTPDHDQRVQQTAVEPIPVRPHSEPAVRLDPLSGRFEPDVESAVAADADVEVRTDVSAVPAAPHSPTKPSDYGTDGHPLIYLTFDDGPDPVWTPRVLDLLADHGAPATFFVVGTRVDNYPDLIERMHAEGHDVENHTHLHHRLDQTNAAEFRLQVRGADRAIQAALGADYSTRCLRPPFGARNRHTRAWARSLGKATVYWDIDPQDWRRPGADQIAQTVLSRARPSAVVLLHERGGGRQTLEALDVILGELAERGYRFALLCEHERAATEYDLLHAEDAEIRLWDRRAARRGQSDAEGPPRVNRIEDAVVPDSR